MRWLVGVAMAGLALAGLLAAPGDNAAEQVPAPWSVASREQPSGAVGLAAGSALTCIPTSAHVAGAAGTNWRTDLQVHNPGAIQASYSIALLKHATDNSSPVSQSFTLGPGQSVRYADIIYQRFAFSGKAALRVAATSGTVLVTSRTFNDLASAGSYGQFVPAFPDEGAITTTHEGRIIQLSHQPSLGSGFRTNLGVVNATAGTIAVIIDLHRSDGTRLGQVPLTLKPFDYQQVDKIFERVTSHAVAEGFAVVRTTTSGGRFHAYASVIDNRSSDPIFIPASRIAWTAPPPTPTATPPSAGKPNLVIYKPSTWPGCVVCAPQPTSPPALGSLRAGGTTYVYWAVANLGTAPLTGPVVFGFYLDGKHFQNLQWDNPQGLQAGYYVSFQPIQITVQSIGNHTLEVRADPENLISETNESDNACSFSGYWGGASPAPTTDGAVSQQGWGHLEAGGEPMRVEAPCGQSSTASAASTTWIATSAHASGVAGSNWRTDLEVHNPGSTQASYTVALLKHGTDNSSPVSQAFNLNARRSSRLNDLIKERFSFTGKAALRVTATSGSILLTSRTYNSQTSGTYGQFVPAFPDAEAITPAEEGRIIQLSHQPNVASGGFRTNLGVVNATSATLAVTIDLHHANGSRLGQVPLSLKPYDYQQVDKVFERVTSTAVADGYAVVRTSTSGGRLFAYASVIDNRTSDPVFVPAMAVPPQTGEVVAGPGGTSITLPAGGRTPNATVAITTGSNANLIKTGETLVSTVIRVSVGGEGSSTGAGMFVVRIPVTGAVTDPSKLLLKVKTSVGRVYPVAGTYDTGARVFSAEVGKLWDGWTMGVVTRPGLQVDVPQIEEGGNIRLAGWITPEDWRTCAWKTLDHTGGATGTFRGSIRQALGLACEHLRAAQFRSPKLWIDTRLSPHARILHVVRGLGSDDPTTSFSSSSLEDDAAFSAASFNDEQMHSLGQLYFNWDEFQTIIRSNNWSNGHVAIHELLHAAQSGYDIRAPWWRWAGYWENPLMWLQEGTATPVGMTYQTNPGGINGGTVTVRPLEPPQKLDEIMQSTLGQPAYARQDFFAYFAKRYNGGSFRDLPNLYQQLSNATDGQFGKSPMEYLTMYRRGMHNHYSQRFNVTLPDLYTEFVVDRAYRHNPPALLRAADQSLPKNSLDTSLFGTVTTWDPSTQPVLFSTVGIYPLTSWAIKVTVPAAARQVGTLTLPISVTGVPLSRQGVRIFIFRENGNVMVTDGEREIKDISQPVNVPVSASVQTLTILVINGSIEYALAYVVFGQQQFTRFSEGYSEVHTCYDANCATGVSCSSEADGEFFGPVTWNRNTFSYSQQGFRFEGELSADRQTILRFRRWHPQYLESDWRNLPKIASRSNADRWVYGVSGAAARGHIATWFICERQVAIDWTMPVVAEVWLEK